MRRRKSARSGGFAHGRIQRSAFHIAHDAPSRGGPLFDSTAAAGRENNYRSASGVVNGERKKKLSLDRNVFLHQHGFDRELTDFHREHPRRVTAHIIRSLGKHHATHAGPPGCPGLNLDDDFAALLAASKFLRRHDRVISGRSSAATRNLESVGGQDRFALILVQSCHGRKRRVAGLN